MPALPSNPPEPLDTRAVENAIDARFATLGPAELTPGKPAYYAAKAWSENTWKAYRSAIQDYVNWYKLALPFPSTPEMVAAYLANRALVYKRNTLNQRVAAIAFVHRMLGYDDPTQDSQVRQVLRGIRRDKAEHQETLDRAPAFTASELVALLDGMDDSLRDRRDRAYILIGFAGAFRQSELNALQVEQLERHDDGLSVTMGIVKTDQTGDKQLVKALPYADDPSVCPVRALNDWLDAARINKGPVFRAVDKKGRVGETPLSHTATNQMLKRRARRAGLADANRYSGHSLRASFVTILRDLGVEDALTARQTHHVNLRMMSVYDRPGDAFAGNPTGQAVDQLAKCAKIGPKDTTP